MLSKNLWRIAVVAMLLLGAFGLSGAPAAQAQTTSATSCKMVVGTRVVSVPNGTVDDATGQTCSNGVWGTLPATSSLTYVPRGNTYARSVQLVDSWQRVREGAATGQFFPWNFLVRVSCDRALTVGEVSWDHPTLLAMTAASDDLACQISLKRDLESSKNWEDLGAEMDPYDSSLRGPDGTKQGEQLGWFLGSNGGVIKINEEPQFLLDISVCTTCTVPTDISQAGVLLPEDWTAPPSDADYAEHHAAIVYPFGRNDANVLTYLIQLEKGQSAVLWQGILVDEIIMPSPTDK